MKVGVDARLLARPLTGIGLSILEICRAISKMQNISIQLYSSEPFQNGVMFNLDRVSSRTAFCQSTIFRQLWSETYLPYWAKKDNVDLFWGPAHRLPRWLPKQMARVVTVHDLVWKDVPQSMRMSTRLSEACHMPFAIRSADQVVAVSQATADAVMREFAVDPDKLTVVPLGTRMVRPGQSPLSEGADKIKPDGIKQHKINQPYFLFVGTLEPRKNLVRLLHAYCKLSELIRDKVLFVIAGAKGWGGVDIARTIDKLGLKNHVRLLGYVGETTLSELYANCLFLAMPSLYEGFGLPIVEAMSYGKPVVTSNNSSMPEVAGDAGIFVDPLDTDSIRDGLEKMIAEKPLRNKLASRAKENAARFNWDTSAAKLVEIFKKAILVRRGYRL